MFSASLIVFTLSLSSGASSGLAQINFSFSTNEIGNPLLTILFGIMHIPEYVSLEHVYLDLTGTLLSENGIPKKVMIRPASTDVSMILLLSFNTLRIN